MTTSVKVSVVEPAESVTLKVTVKVPLALVLPVSVPVPPPEELNTTPLGSLPDSVILPGVGGPTAMTWKVALTPWVNVVVLALVNLGAWLTVRVNAWVVLGVTPFDDMKVTWKVPPTVGVPFN